MYSNGNSFGESIGNSADHGSGTGYGTEARDGTLPASAGWGMFAARPVWRIVR